MKKYIAFLLSSVLILGASIPVSANTDVQINVNGNFLSDAQAVLKDGSTLLPVRSVSTALGGEVVWDSATKTASIDKDGTQVTITIGAKQIFVNGNPETISTPAQIINGRTYVPLRALGEALNCNIAWVNETKTVEITQVDPAEYKVWYEVDDMGRLVLNTNISSQNWDGYTVVTSISVSNDNWRKSRTEWDTEHRQKQEIVHIRPRGFYSHYEDGTIIRSTDVYIFKGIIPNLKDSMRNPAGEIASVSDKLVYKTTLRDKITITESAQPLTITDLHVAKDTKNMKDTYTVSLADEITKIGEYDLQFRNSKSYSSSSGLQRTSDSLKSTVDMGFYSSAGEYYVSHTLYTKDEKGSFQLIKSFSNTISSNQLSH